MAEYDPNGISANSPGAKLDGGKPQIHRGLLDYFPRACIAVAGVSATGASKYTWKGWESVPDGVQRYTDALVRHVIGESIDGPYDYDTGLLHKSQAAWNALAALEIYLRENAIHNTGSKETAGKPADSGGTQLLPNHDMQGIPPGAYAGLHDYQRRGWGSGSGQARVLSESSDTVRRTEDKR